MRWMCIFVSAVVTVAASAQDFQVSPTTVRQGETVKLSEAHGAASARLQGFTVRLFDAFGMMPVQIREVPGTYPLEFLDLNGMVIHSTSITVRDARYPKQNVVLSKAIADLRSTADEDALVSAFHKIVSGQRYWAEPLQAPVPGCITSPFGAQRYQNGVATGAAHGGLDQRGAAGTPVHAVAAGVVGIARTFDLRGGTVAIDHGQGFASMYLHMSKITAKEGSVVAAGDVVGFVGSTGRSTAPHLHWSLYVSGVPVSPLQWVTLRPCAAPAKRPTEKKR